MGLLPQVRQSWIDTQRNFDYPVNAIGVRINPNDAKTLQVWRDEKIDVDGRFAGTGDSNVTPVPSDSKTEKGATTLMYRGAVIAEAPDATPCPESISPATPTGEEPVLMYRGVPVK